MLRIRHQVNNLKRQKIISKVVSQPEEEQQDMQGQKSFQPKYRLRRQYNPDDINIAKLFLAIREHRTGNPPKDKLREIKTLLDQIQNINDIDYNDNGNTLLHVAVNKDHQDIVKLLLEEGAKVDIENSIGDTPQDIAKKSNKKEIVQLLKTHRNSIGQEPFIGYSRSGPSSQTHSGQQTGPSRLKSGVRRGHDIAKTSGEVEILSEKEAVEKKLPEFVEDFVSIYESSLSEYYKRLENRISKPGEWANFVNKIIETGTGVTEGIEVAGKKASSIVGIHILQSIVSGTSNRKELKKLIYQLYIFKEDPGKVRKELVKSGIEIFQGFESQFTQLTSDGSWQRAMAKLAEDAVGRVFDGFRKNAKEEFSASSITKGVILGKSKKYKHTFTDIPHLNPGHTLEDNNSNSWNTAELFDKAGLVIIKSDGTADKYYKRKDGKSDTSKYGYRLLFQWESENKVNEEYRVENPTSEKKKHILKPNEKKELENILLDKTNNEDPKLLKNYGEVIKRIEQEAEENVNKLEKFISNNFDELSSYIETHQNEIRVIFNGIEQQSRKNHQEASQQRKDKGFEPTNQKLNEIVARQESHTALDLAYLEVKDYISSTYKRTKGAAGIEGQLCEVNLSMLLLLKGITDEQIEGFHLASNMEKADKFDDIVFKFEYKEGITEKSKIVFLQAKHKTDKKGVTINSLLSDSESGDFSLKKYFISYHKIKQQFSETKDPVFSSKFEDSEFIIYTNAPFVSTDSSIKEGNVNQNDFFRISDSQSKYYQLEFNSNKKERIINLLKNSSDSRRLAKELVQSISSGNGIDMQKDIFQSYHIALQGIVIEKIDNKLEGKLSDTFLNDDASSSLEDKEFRRVFLEEAEKVFKKQGNELKQKLQKKVVKLSNKFGVNSGSENLKLPNDDPITEDEIIDFLNKFKLFVSQPSEKDLEKIIKDKVKEVYKVEQQDIDSVFSDVEYKVKTWWQSGNNYLRKDNKFFEDAARISINFDVKEPVTLFTGRVKELDDLHKILNDGGEAVISQMASVTGLGGIGKSELARKYISKHNKEYDNNIIWINADNYLSIAESFRRLAQVKLRISTTDENGKEKETKLIVEDVYRFFAKRHRRSLFIFDNAGKHKAVSEIEEAEGVDKFLPFGPNKPHVLITSSDQEWGEIKSLPLSTFTEEEAVEFIKKALKDIIELEENEIKKLAEELQYLPLALRQAVDYIKVENQRLNKWKKEKFTVGNYLEQFNEKANELLSRESSETRDRYTKTVMTTWQIIIDKIKRKGAIGGEQALEILNVIAYLAPDKIPIDDIFSKLIDEEEIRHSAVELLNQYSMANLEDGKLNIHRLVQQVTRIKLERENKEEKIVGEAFKLLTESFFYGSDRLKHYTTNRLLLPHLEAFLSHIKDWVAKKSEEDKQKIETDYLKTLLILMVDGYSVLGNPRRTKELLERVLKIQEKYYGLDHVEVAITLANLGIAYGDLGNPQKKKELLERALKIKEKYYGLDHFEVAITLANLGIAYGDLGNPQKQKELLERALKIQKKHYGPDHFEVAATLSDLGNAYGNLGDPKKKKKLLQQALKIEEKHYSPDHFQVAITLASLGNAYGDLGDPKKKKELLERALRVEEKHYGSDHFEVARTLVNLGNAYGDLGDPQKQKDLLERALKIQEKHYGPDHFEVASALVNLGRVYGDLGDPQKQKKLLERALKLKEKHYGPDHFEVAIALQNLSNAYWALADPQKPKELLERALQIQEKHYGLDHFEVAIILRNLGIVYGALGDPQKKKELLERALKIQEKQYGLDHFNIAVTLANLGNAYGDLGDPQKRKELLERALKIQEKHYGPDHFKVTMALANLGNAYGDLGNPQKQKELLEQALKIQEKHYGPDHFEVAAILINLGNAYGTLGDPKKKKELLERALKIEEKHYSPDHFEVAITLANLGNAYGDLGDPQKQKELLERALKIEEKHYGPAHFEIVGTLESLGNAYGDLGDPQKQKELLQRALKIKENHYSPDHFEVVRTLVNLGIAYEDLGDPQKQKELLERALKVEEKHYGPDHFEVARTLVKLGKAYGALGDPQKKKELLKRALKIEEKHYGPNHFEVAVTLVVLGNAYGVLGDPQKQKKLLERALPIFEKHSHPFVATLRRALDELSSLRFACRNGYPDLVKTLMDGGADVLARNNHDTVLHQAVSSNNEEVIRLILDKIKEKYSQRFFEHINVRDTEGDTPLMWAAENENTNAAKILLEYGADPNVKNDNGETALHWAAKCGYQGVLQILLNKQADSNSQDKNGKTPFDLAQEKLTQDPENDNLKTIMGLLLSITDESKYQQQEEHALGLVSVDECLPSTSHNRRKRKATGECLFTWEDVDKFNTEQDKKRDLDKIKIDSEKFVYYIKDLQEGKCNQLIQLADKVRVTGESQSLVNKLIGNQKIMSHLNRIERVSGMTMHGMMAKNVLADFLNGDYKGVAINVGFIAGGQGFAKVAEAASIKGRKLALEGELLLGRSFKAASPFFARGTSAFVIYDLVNQVKAFKNGTEEALVGVIGDSIYLGVDVVEIGIEIAEAFEVLEEVSSITGPIGAAIGAVVFVGTDIYMAVKRVDKIDQIIHLKGSEKFIEGLRAFIGMQPEQYIEKVMEEKQLYNQLVKQGLEYLKQHSDIQSYIFPTGKSVVDSCRKVPYQVSNCASGGFGGGCLRASTVTRYAEECITKFEIDLDSIVLLDRKRADIKWSRAKPDNPRGGQLFCLSKGSYRLAPSYGSYLCESAIGITDLSTSKTKTYTLINLGEGEDYAKGFIDSPNIFVVNSGFKKYFGGNKDDIFIVQGTTVKGYFYGEGGLNTLDLTSFASEEESIDVKLHVGQVEDYYRDNYLLMSGINRFLGRRTKADQVFITCDGANDVQFIDGQGGSDEFVDHINIHDKDCAYNMQIVVRPNTVIYNRALKGNFHYTVPYGSGSTKVNFLYSKEELNVNNTFTFEYEPVEIKSIDVKDVNTFNKTLHTIRFNFSPMSDKEFNITISGASNPFYRLGNNTEIKVGNKGNLYMLENTNKSVDEIIRDYLVVANQLNKMSFFIQSLLSNETVVIGSGNYEIIHNNPLHKSHLVGNGGENVYVIDSEYKALEVNKLPLNEVTIYDFDAESSIDTIDLRNLVQQARSTFSNNFEVHVLKSANDLLLKATITEVKPTEDLSLSKMRKHEYFTVRLKDGINWYNKTHVIIDSAPMKINLNNNKWSLKPQPLMFEKNKEVIVVTSQDVEENTELITPKRAGNYTFVRNRGADLIITNTFDAVITKEDFCTIILSKFYAEPKMETLSIKFADKEITLKDHQEQISIAREMNVVAKEYKDQVYNDVFNRTESSPEVIMLSDQSISRKHRHDHSRHRQKTRHRRSDNITNSGTRPSSWINNLFGWMKVKSNLLRSSIINPVGRWFIDDQDFNASSENMSYDSATQNYLKAVDFSQIDVNGTILLADVLLAKRGKRQISISATDQGLSQSQTLGYTLNIGRVFEEAVKEAALKTGISERRLNIDFVEIEKMKKEINNKVVRGRFDEISQVLKTYADKVCPKTKKGSAGMLSPKKFNEFMDEFNNLSSDQSIQKILHNSKNNVLENKNVQKQQINSNFENKKPKSYLGNNSVRVYLTQLEDLM